MMYHKEQFCQLLDQAEKVAAQNARHRWQVRFTLGDRLKPEAREQLLALRRQLANN